MNAHRPLSKRLSSCIALMLPCMIFLSIVAFATSSGNSQDTAGDNAAPETATVAPKDDEAPVVVTDKVEVEPVNSDEKIATRLSEIYRATKWFTDIEVRVDGGVAFLRGQSDTEKHRDWAEATAIKTSDVVAVVNQLSVIEKPFWNLSPAWESMVQLARETTSLIPLMVVAMAIVVISYYVSLVVGNLGRRVAGHRFDSQLLVQVTGNAIAVVVFIVGIYVALRVSGLTRLAVTLLGGTGLVGLALGFAFRDIVENYLASILISLNHPFRVGDLIEVDGAKGFVRMVTTRGTILNTLEGNQMQIPNSTVYKSKVLNFTATPLMRLEFGVGIGFDDSTTQAQDLIMRVLENHSGVVKEPAPMVLVDSLGSATVNLKVYYWFNQTNHSGLKVGSSVIRQVKQVLTEAKIKMPDEAREVVFPDGVPIRILRDQRSQEQTEPSPQNEDKNADISLKRNQVAAKSVDVIADADEITRGEGDLRSDQDDVMNATADDETTADEKNLIA